MDPEQQQRHDALAYLQPDETASQFFARVHTEPILTGVDFIDQRSPLRPNSILEICGLADTGKTEFLYNIAATFIMPTYHHGIYYGGHDRHVLFFDLDCKFDIVRFGQIISQKIARALRRAPPPVPPAPNQFNETAFIIHLVQNTIMPRFHLISCHSSFDFLAALAVIKPTITHVLESTTSSTTSSSAIGTTSGGGLGVIMLDNCAAYYYSDRCNREGTPFTLPRVHMAMLAGLKTVQYVYKIPIIVTRHVLGHLGSSAWNPKDVMIKQWQSAVTERIFLHKESRGGTMPPPRVDGGLAQSESKMIRLAKVIKPEKSGDDVIVFTIGSDGIK